MIDRGRQASPHGSGTATLGILSRHRTRLPHLDLDYKMWTRRKYFILGIYTLLLSALRQVMVWRPTRHGMAPPSCRCMERMTHEDGTPLLEVWTMQFGLSRRAWIHRCPPIAHCFRTVTREPDRAGEITDIYPLNSVCFYSRTRQRSLIGANWS